MDSISAKCKSIEEKTTNKDDGSEVKAYKAVFEHINGSDASVTKITISRERHPFEGLVVGQIHEIDVECSQTTLE